MLVPRFAIVVAFAITSQASAQFVQAGFNDNVGINSNGTVNSPYNIVNAPLAGQGAGEAGWATTWQVGNNAPTVINSGVFEGDGALFMQNTSAAFRGLSQPITGVMSVQVQMKFSSSIVSGNGVNFYVKQFTTDATGPQWQALANGHIAVIDGTENGTQPTLDTGFTWTPGVFQTFRMDIDTVARTWEFYFNGVKYVSPTPLGYRDAPVFLDRIQMLTEVDAPNGATFDAVYVGPVPEPSFTLVILAASVAIPVWHRSRRARERISSADGFE